jgi:hypothetical protein
MTRNDIGTEILGEAACWERLRKSSIGRLGVVHDDKPAIYPVNYLVDGTSILFRTAPGSKVASAQKLDRVAFEIDGFEPRQGDAWSVLIKGFARQLDSTVEIDRADELPLFPWVTADRSAWVRIVPVEVTGRRFHIVDQVVTDGSLGWPARVGNADRSSAV